MPGGFADAYLEEHFGWEFKGDDADLEDGLLQLLRYQVHLKTPPLLIVSSFRTIWIQTNFPGMETVRHEIPVAALDQPAHLDKLRYAFFAPVELRPDRSVDTVTRETADLFQAIVADMEEHTDDPERLARYLNQIVFCLYAEDAGLLPGTPFSQIVREHFKNPVLFDQAIGNLFGQMAKGGMFGATPVAYFNGDLFNNSDTVELSSLALGRLAEATEKNWRNIEPSIFGTLFERALDASKRSHLGAHYTSADDIMLVVEPVVMAPLRDEWEAAQRDIGNLLIEDDRDAARVRLEAFQQRLFEIEVLDPACGSGNFLYLALRSLLDLEKRVIDFAAANGWDDLTPRAKPDQMLGLEINPYAAELARTALWIGYIQWHRNNGFPYNHRPILTPLVSIRRTDAILAEGDTDSSREPEWPPAEFIIGNPPGAHRNTDAGTGPDFDTARQWADYHLATAGRRPHRQLLRAVMGRSGEHHKRVFRSPGHRSVPSRNGAVHHRRRAPVATTRTTCRSRNRGPRPRRHLGHRSLPIRSLLDRAAQPNTVLPRLRYDGLRRTEHAKRRWPNILDRAWLLRAQGQVHRRNHQHRWRVDRRGLLRQYGSPNRRWLLQ